MRHRKIRRGTFRRIQYGGRPVVAGTAPFAQELFSMAIRQRKGRKKPWEVYWNNPFTLKRESLYVETEEEAKKQDLLVSFDPGQDLGMYDTDKLRDVITNTTILFGNHHEIRRILESLEVDLDGLREIGPKIIVKTCGANGSEIYSNNEKIKIDAIVREAVDPTGAGDSYRAGFLSRFLNGESLEQSAKFASSVSSFIVEQQGCQTNMPTFDDAFDRMSEFY